MNHLDSLEPRQLFTAVFGTNGSARLAIKDADGKAINVPASQVLTDASGRTYVVEQTRDAVYVQRLTVQGLLDSGYGTNGQIIATRKGRDSVATKAQIDANGRLVLLAGNDVYRYTVDGQADASFNGGNAVYVGGTITKAADMAVDASNHIYVTGSVFPADNVHDTQSRVMRLISRGKIDRAFQHKGVYDVPDPAPVKKQKSITSAGVELKALSDGSVISASTLDRKADNPTIDGRFNTDLDQGVTAVKFLATGELDGHYGTHGVSTTFAPADSRAGVYFLSFNGIRGTGAVSLHIERDATGDDYSTQEYDVQITRKGRYDPTIVQYFSPHYAEAFGETLAFTPLPDGDELVTNNEYTLTLDKPGGDYDPAFLSGRPIQLTDQATTGTTYGAVVGARPDGSFEAVSYEAKTGQLIVQLYNADGSKVKRGDPNSYLTSLKPITKGGTSIKFSVLFRAAAGIDAKTITASSIRVNPSSASQSSPGRPKLIDVMQQADLSYVATYKIAPPGGGSWTSADNGNYDVEIVGHQVKDGNGAYLDQVSLGGGLTVNIA